MQMIGNLAYLAFLCVEDIYTEPAKETEPCLPCFPLCKKYLHRANGGNGALLVLLPSV